MRSKKNVRDIDFLAVYNHKDKKGINKTIIKLIIPPLVLILIFAGMFGYFTVSNNSLQSDIDSLQHQLDEELKKNNENSNQEQANNVEALQTELNNLQEINTNLGSYPQISKEILDHIRTSCSKVTLSSIGYTQDSGEIVLEMSASSVQGCQDAVRALRNTTYFDSVKYLGYTRSGGETTTVPSENTITEAITDDTTESQTNTTQQETTVTTPIAYTTSVTCVVKGGN